MTSTREETHMDWQQVVLSGGPPCFAILDDEDGWYCGRAQRWEGHDGEHEFVSLQDLLAQCEAAVRAEERERAATIAETSYEQYQTGYNAGKFIATAIRREPAAEGEGNDAK